MQTREQKFNVAFRHCKNGNYAKALALFNEVIQLDATDEYAFRSYYYGSVCLYRLDDYHGAIEAINKAFRLKVVVTDPEKRKTFFANLQFYWGSALFKLGNFNEAIEQFSIGLQLDPEYTELYQYRGHANAKLGQYKAAYDDVKRAYELNPELDYICHDIGWNALQIVESVAEGEHEYCQNAAKMFEMSIEKYPDFAESYFLLGKCYQYLQRDDQAIEVLQIALDRGIVHAEIHFSLAVCHRRLQHETLTLYHLDKAILLDTTEERAFVERGFFHKDHNDYHLALADYDKAIQLAPHYAPYRETRQQFAEIKAEYDGLVATAAGLDHAQLQTQLDDIRANHPTIIIDKFVMRARNVRAWAKYAITDAEKVALCDVDPLNVLCWFNFVVPRITKKLNYDVVKYISTFVTGLKTEAKINVVALATIQKLSTDRVRWVEQGIFKPARQLRATPQRMESRKKAAERDSCSVRRLMG